jgi:phenylpropionate dioxygenase-like ring-hydroxylating dioxygenase large terminal subunit
VSLRNFWVPAAFSGQLGSGRPCPVQLFGEPLVLFRDTGGVAHCLADYCPHRGAPLSLGDVDGDVLRCRYHGWHIDGGGTCSKLPSLDDPAAAGRRASVPSYPVREAGGVLWAWLGDPAKAALREPPVPAPPADRDGPFAEVNSHVDIASHFSQVMANLVDPAHVPFLHVDTLARYANLREHRMRFARIDERADGVIVSQARYEDEPVTAQTPTYNHTIYSPFVTNDRYRDPAKTLVVDFWYLMVPIAPGKTRYLFRQYRNFLTHPLIRRAMNWRFRRFADVALEEDRVIVEGQHARLAQGLDFKQLVATDTLVLRYQRMVNALDDGKAWFAGYGGRTTGDAEVCRGSLGRYAGARMRASRGGSRPVVAADS